MRRIFRFCYDQCHLGTGKFGVVPRYIHSISRSFHGQNHKILAPDKSSCPRVFDLTSLAQSVSTSQSPLSACLPPVSAVFVAESQGIEPSFGAHQDLRRRWTASAATFGLARNSLNYEIARKYISLSLSISLSLYLSISLSLYLSISLSIYLSIYLSNYIYSKIGRLVSIPICACMAHDFK